MKKKKFAIIVGFLGVFTFLAVFPPMYAPYAFQDKSKKSAIRKELVTEGLTYQSFTARIQEIGQDQVGTKYNVSLFHFETKSIVTVPIHVDKDWNGNYRVTALDNMPY